MYPTIKEFNVNEVTLYSTQDIKPGMAVMIADNCTGEIPVANARFAGVCTAVRGNYISVALSGIVTVSFSGSNITTGYNFLSADGNGCLKFNINSDVEYLVLGIDEKNKLMTILL